MKDIPILLVEDNPDDEELTLLALKEAGVANEIVVARDGVDALDRLFGEGGYAGHAPLAPQVILLDLKLPRIGGLDVLRRIRANPATELIPVVVMTSSSEEEDIVASYKLRANSYVRKPVEFRAFTEAVRTVGMYWLLVNESVARRARE